MTVTLETLHSDFLLASEKDVASSIPDPLAGNGAGAMVPFLTKYADHADFTVDEWATSPYASKETTMAATLYVIARDSGLEAAMVHKLTFAGA